MKSRNRHIIVPALLLIISISVGQEDHGPEWIMNTVLKSMDGKRPERQQFIELQADGVKLLTITLPTLEKPIEQARAIKLLIESCNKNGLTYESEVGGSALQAVLTEIEKMEGFELRRNLYSLKKVNHPSVKKFAAQYTSNPDSDVKKAAQSVVTHFEERRKRITQTI